MTVNFYKGEVGSGVFTTADVAAILNQPHQRVLRFIKEYGDLRLGRKLYNETYSWKVDGVRLVNFQALIELAVFFLLREKYHLTIGKINEAREIMSGRFKTAYPFANCKVLTDTETIFYLESEELTAANKGQQIIMREVVEPLLAKIEFDGNIASRYFPLGKQAEVVVDPHHQFGQPIVKNTNIRTDTLGRLHEGGESPESLQRLYDLSAEQIEDALRFYRQAA
jgi:uncharacterized protein (DUF433 family)